MENRTINQKIIILWKTKLAFNRKTLTSSTVSGDSCSWNRNIEIASVPTLEWRWTSNAIPVDTCIRWLCAIGLACA